MGIVSNGVNLTVGLVNLPLDLVLFAASDGLDFLIQIALHLSHQVQGSFNILTKRAKFLLAFAALSMSNRSAIWRLSRI